jgi:predicted RNA binding protein YcfA (HicA-like mRNA interferase family)
VKLPRDVAGRELASALNRLGYEITHQTGSHMRLTTQRDGEHHVTIPAHDPIRVGTLSAILRDIAEHHGLSRDDLLRALFS